MIPFLSARGEGTPDRAKYSIASKGREVSGIRVTRSEMEAIREAAKTFDFHFNILSVNTRTEEVREHLSTCLNPFPLIHRGSEIPQSNSSTGQHILDVAPSRDI